MKKILTLMMILAVCFVPLFAEDEIALDAHDHDHSDMTFPEYLVDNTDDPDSVFETSEEEDMLLRKAVEEAVGDYDLTGYESIGMFHKETNMTELYLYNNDTYDLIMFAVYDSEEKRDEMFADVIKYANEGGFIDMDENPAKYVAELGEEILGEGATPKKGVYYAGMFNNRYYILSIVIPG